MHAPDSDRLASFADILAGELPDVWTSTFHPSDDKAALAHVTDRTWDMDLIVASLAEHPLHHAAVLTRVHDQAQLAVMDRHDERGGFLIAALSPNLDPEAFRGIVEPHGIALSDDPFIAAATVSGDLLARHDAALAQVRRNAADLAADASAAATERVVLAWQPNGDLTAAPTSGTAQAVLQANGFAREPDGTYRLNGEDSTALARAVRKVSRQFTMLGITTAVQHPSARPAPTATAPAPPPPTRPALHTR
ncbi:hypothetical protein ACFYVL_09405 [Streptomyces sp. NPDC004111]|uniref:hypothetical protein n=1 Tax=Streptomyces sp. NPDC004111 TaxID=3364690 RepID=UPI0036C3BC97